MRRLVGIVLAVVVLVAGFSAVWAYMAEESPSTDLVLVEALGQVELDRPGAKRVEVRAGTVLESHDRVKTGEEATAVLGLGRETRIKIGPVSSVEVLSVHADEVRLELEDGLLEATVRPESGALRVGSQGREVVATNGAFSMGVRGDVVQVQALEGDMVLSGVDRTRLSAGSEATFVDRHAEVVPVPEELLLHVDWPAPGRTAATRASLTGTTTPGAAVEVRGPSGEVASAVAAGDGSFTVDVPLREGDNTVRVRAGDLLGRSTEEEGALPERDTEAFGAPRGPANYGLRRP